MELELELGLGVADLLKIATRQQVNDRRRAAQTSKGAGGEKLSKRSTVPLQQWAGHGALQH